jgi:hypothetical protein
MYKLENFEAFADAVLNRISAIEQAIKTAADAEKLLTGKQVDQLYGISKVTRIAWQKKGLLTPIRKGRRNYFKPELKP